MSDILNCSISGIKYCSIFELNCSVLEIRFCVFCSIFTNILETWTICSHDWRCVCVRAVRVRAVRSEKPQPPRWHDRDPAALLVYGLRKEKEPLRKEKEPPGASRLPAKPKPSCRTRSSNTRTSSRRGIGIAGQYGSAHISTGKRLGGKISNLESDTAANADRTTGLFEWFICSPQEKHIYDN